MTGQKLQKAFLCRRFILAINESDSVLKSRDIVLINIFVSPHIGSATRETRDAMGWLLIRGIATLGMGGVPAIFFLE